VNTLSRKQVSGFQEYGYIILRNLFDAEETNILREAAQADDSFKQHVHDIEDGEGGKAQLILWNEAGNNLWGTVARSERIVHSMEQLLHDEVYHYHSKMSIKLPNIGGAWNWHQDYGYWYQNGCLYPDMASAFIALDANKRDNGCLKVLEGSHKMGRIDHGRYGEQTGADPERVDEAIKVMELTYIELEPGDTVFLHSNLLHSSDQNSSEYKRWSLICCYNTKHNNPYKDSHHPRYEPLEKLPDSTIKEMSHKLFAANTVFWNPSDDATTGAGKESN
ncbi:uncharacterized protein METZ01_LOCUS121826, partial [marine metagenome]